MSRVLIALHAKHGTNKDWCFVVILLLTAGGVFQIQFPCLFFGCVYIKNPDESSPGVPCIWKVVSMPGWRYRLSVAKD